MAREFARDGIRLQYPDNWTVEAEDTEDGWSASIMSPDTAFLMLSHYPDDYTPAALADMGRTRRGSRVHRARYQFAMGAPG